MSRFSEKERKETIQIILKRQTSVLWKCFKNLKIPVKTNQEKKLTAIINVKNEDVTITVDLETLKRIVRSL